MQDLDMAVPQSEAHPSPDLSVTELTLPARIRNLLLNSGLNTVGDVLNALARGEEELLNIKGFGPKSLVELKKCLAESGLLASASPHRPRSLHRLLNLLPRPYLFPHLQPSLCSPGKGWMQPSPTSAT
jgi:hypothetical protein